MMKTKIFLFLLTLLTCSKAFATPVQCVGSVPQFAIATVGGRPVFTTAQRDAELAANPGAQVVNLTPTAIEVALSTTIASFGGPGISPVDDFRGLLTSKPYIAERARDITADLVAEERLQELYPSLPLTVRINRLKAQINLLFAIWSSL